MHNQQPPGVVQNWATLQCSKQNTEQCGYDHAPVTRGRMRAQFPLPHGPKTTAPPTPPKEGGDGADDGTKVRVPNPTRVEVDTVTGVRWRKAGVVWVEYPENTQLYEVARGLLFPTREGAQEHLVRIRQGKGKATPPPPPPPSFRASLTRRQTPCLTPRLTPDKPQN